jgi:hypothetical protein
MVSKKMTVEQILTIVGFTAIAIAVAVIAKTLVHILLYREVLSVHFFLYLAMWVSIPCLLLALVKKYRKKAVIPPMIVCGLSVILDSFLFMNLWMKGPQLYWDLEVTLLFETLILIAIFVLAFLFSQHGD